VEEIGGEEVKDKFLTGSGGVHKATIASVLRALPGSLFKKVRFLYGLPT
jgi:hypothetical protein